MSRNTLKVIACISMLIDHIGYILLPEYFFLRYIGRLAMPIFAFFIGEGCLYTRDRKKYFFRIFSLGLVCQFFYVLEYFIFKTGDPFYFNILLTFSSSVILCSAFLNSLNENGRCKKGKENLILGLVLTVIIIISYLDKKDIIPIHFDYGMGGMILPLFSATTKERKKKFFTFAAGLLLCVLSLNYRDDILTVCALSSLIPLAFYNGKPGKKNLTKAFYLFYPIHLGVIYLISFFL